ncbi:MAG: M48 family metallopeptidase [Oscillospiraceae bacterium]|nr:M48 family metallopeptidase [Oscillospiraceae bacterium]
MNYTLTRSNRKTIGLCVRPDGSLEVRAPMHCPAREIERALREKAAWIAEKQQMMQQRQVNAVEITPELEAQCRLQATAVLPGRVEHFAGIMRVAPKAVRITGAMTRWGSCSSCGRVSFAWRLMLCDDELIDYVVVHELAHLREMNHGPQFWAVVESVLPDYKRRIAKLRKQPVLVDNRE